MLSGFPIEIFIYTIYVYIEEFKNRTTEKFWNSDDLIVTINRQRNIFKKIIGNFFLNSVLKQKPKK